MAKTNEKQVIAIPSMIRKHGFGGSPKEIKVSLTKKEKEALEKKGINLDRPRGRVVKGNHNWYLRVKK